MGYQCQRDVILPGVEVSAFVRHDEELHEDGFVWVIVTKHDMRVWYLCQRDEVLYEFMGICVSVTKCYMRLGSGVE